MGRGGGGVAARVGGGTLARAGGTLSGVETRVVPEACAPTGSLSTTLELPLDGVPGDSLAVRDSLADAAFVDAGAVDAAGLDGALLLLT